MSTCSTHADNIQLDSPCSYRAYTPLFCRPVDRVGSRVCYWRPNSPSRVATPCNAHKSPGSKGIETLCSLFSGRFPNTWKRRTEMSTAPVNQLYIYKQLHATDTAVAPICTELRSASAIAGAFTWKRRTEMSTAPMNRIWSQLPCSAFRDKSLWLR